MHAVGSRLAELNASLMLFYTGISRFSSDVASTYVNDLETKKRQLRIAKDLVDDDHVPLAGAMHAGRQFKLDVARLAGTGDERDV